MFKPSDPQIPLVTQQGSLITVKNRYWRVEHDLKQGGCPVSIYFHYGSEENLLVDPMGAHIGKHVEHIPGKWIGFYKQACDSDAKAEIKETKDGVSLTITGVFKLDDDNQALPIRYKQVYLYRGWGHVGVTIDFIFEEGFNDIFEIAPCNIFLNPKVDRLGVRHSSSPDDVPSEPAIFWHDVKFSRSWRSARYAHLNHSPLYWCALREEVEGLEFFRGADSSFWNCFAGLEQGHNLFTHERTVDNRHFLVRNELFNTIDGIEIEPGTYTLDYHLGLPFVKPEAAVRNTCFHTRTRATDWPSKEDIIDMAKAEVKVVRHHDDNVHREKGWPDGLYPPYAPEDMKEMDRMIKDMDDAGIRVAPYFSMKEFNPQCPAFAENAAKWARVTRLKYPVDGINSCYGAYMCQRSGWVEYLKSNIDNVLNKHKFHGLYFDHLWPRECRHPDHCNGHQHSDVDAMIDFMMWARKRVGTDGILFTHDSRCPCMIFENMSDLIIIGEGNLQCAPQPGGFEPEAIFIPITPRHSVDFVQTDDIGIRNSFFISLIQEGFPPNITFEKEMSEVDQWVMNEFRKVGKFVADKEYRHITARKKPVGCPDGVFAAVFSKSGEAVIYAANHCENKQKVLLKPHFLEFLYDGNSHFQIDSNEKIINRSLRELLYKGIEVEIEPSSSLLVKLKETTRS